MKFGFNRLVWILILACVVVYGILAVIIFKSDLPDWMKFLMLIKG